MKVFTQFHRPTVKNAYFLCQLLDLVNDVLSLNNLLVLESFSRVSLVLHQKLQFSLKLVHLRLEVDGRVLSPPHLRDQVVKLVIVDDLVEEDLRVTLVALEDFDQLLHVQIDVPLRLKELEQHIFIRVLLVHLEYISSLILLLDQLLMMLLEDVIRILLVKLDSPLLARIGILVARLHCVLDTYACY